MAASFSDVTPIRVEMPVKVWVGGVVAFATVVGMVTLAWADLRGGQKAIADRTTSIESNANQTAAILQDTVRALAELRGEVHGVRHGGS